MKIETIRESDFSVIKNADESITVLSFNHKYTDVIKSIAKKIDYIQYPHGNNRAFFSLEKMIYALFPEDYIFFAYDGKHDCFFINLNKNIDEYKTISLGDLFYDITNIVIAIKKILNVNCDIKVVDLFEEIQTLSSYELNQDMNPSKVAYNLSTINAIVNNYLKIIKNN